MATPNREYKSSLFASYFSDKKRLIAAYNAIAGTNYPPTAKVEFKTIENTLYRSISNDLAFMLEDRFIVLIEHQSTINENMPLRFLIYVAEILRRIVPNKTLYGTHTTAIPTPEFFVFYNGTEKYPDHKILKLSDAFIVPTNMPTLELPVPVYNITKGHNADLLKQCTPLSDYSVFVTCVREWQAEGYSLDTAIDKAIHYCIQNDIMRIYLENESTEVKRMLSMEWDDNTYREVLLEEGREEGRQEGREEGEVRAKQEMARKLKEEGAETALIVEVTGMSEEEIAVL